MDASVYQQAVSKKLKMDHHESDLYLQDSHEARYIIAGYEFCSNVTRFRSPVDGHIWFCIPFAYDPWWQIRIKK